MSGVQNADNNEQNARQRVILQPLEDNLRVSTMVRVQREVSITALGGEEIFTMNLNRNYLDVQLIRIITSKKEQKAHLYSRSIGRNRTTARETHFSRIFQCRIYSSTNFNDHGTIIYLMEAKNSNKALFDRNLELRDNGTITIGSFVRIIAPQPIEDYMNGDIPLLKTSASLIVLLRPRLMPTVTINYEVSTDQSMAFCLNNRILHLNQTSVIATTCNGLMCDKGNINEWNNIKGCGCVGMNPNISNLAFVHSIWIEDQTNVMQNITRKVTHSEFSSTKFSRCYLSGRIPATVRKTTLNPTSDVFWALEDCITNVINFVNENDGWTVVGWYKRGSMKDCSLIEASNNNNSNEEDTTVASGKLNMHIIELLPTNHLMMNSTTELGRNLDALKFDVGNLSNHTVVTEISA